MKALPPGGRHAAVASMLAVALLAAGCASTKLDRGLNEYRAGRYSAAAAELDKVEAAGRDRLLVLMERGMARQAAGRYEDSARDFIRAADEIDKMIAVSVSRDSASMVINDYTQEYQGAPFERTMVHTLNALNHLAVGNFENAAVEARRVLRTLEPERRKSHPDNAGARYVAGLCLQLMDDPSNAALQFREAARLAGGVAVDDATGRVGPPALTNDLAVARAPWTNELVCLILRGLTPFVRGAREDGGADLPPLAGSLGYAEIVADGKVLGRSHLLVDSYRLAWKTALVEAAWRAAKTASRVVIKDQIAHEISKEDDALGFLAYLILFALETPDTRHWSTLPRWLEVARVPCPANLAEYEVVFRSPEGRELRRLTVTAPLARRRATMVSFVLDPAAR